MHNRYLEPGGEDEVVRAESELLRQHGCTVTLVAEQVKKPETVIQEGGLAVSAIWSPTWYDKFRALLRDTKPNAVHVHNFFPNISPSLYYAAAERNIPVIQTLHNYRLFCPEKTFFRSGRVCEDCVKHSLWRSVAHGCYRNSRCGTAAVALMLAVHRCLRTWTRRVDCYVVPTEFSRQKFVAAGLPARKIVVKPNFVSHDPGLRVGMGSGALFVGRLSAGKGVRTLISAWTHLGNRIPLDVVGDGPLLKELEQQVAVNRLSNISFLGRLTGDEVRSRLKRARFLIVPSEFYETFGLSIVEAFACGVPVIASRHGAMEEIVDDGRTGLHFTPGNPQDLAAKAKWAWTHEAEMDIMGHNARNEYEAKYTPDQNYRMLMDIYRQAIRSRGAEYDVPALTSLT